MFGLTELEYAINPQTTLEKFIFLVENVFEHFHRTTTFISFGALLVLVIIRAGKNFFKKWWWIYRIPEVLIVVVVSTGMPPNSIYDIARLADLIKQSFVKY
jgi:nucleoside recognition membrane protein YjiH